MIAALVIAMLARVNVCQGQRSPAITSGASQSLTTPPKRIGGFVLRVTGDEDQHSYIYRDARGVDATVTVVRGANAARSSSVERMLTDQVLAYRNTLLRQKEQGGVDGFAIFFDEPDSILCRGVVRGRQVGTAIKTRGTFAVGLFYVFARDTVSAMVSAVVPTNSWQTSGVHEFASQVARDILR
jgi:hypothetical protein